MIYLIEDRVSKAYKIGYTESNPYGRLAACQVGNPNPLRIVSIIEGDSLTEVKIHNFYQLYHIRGEWFEMQEEILTNFRNRPQIKAKEFSSRELKQVYKEHLNLEDLNLPCSATDLKKQIKSQLNCGYSTIDKILSELLKDEIICFTKKGRNHIYSFNNN